MAGKETSAEADRVTGEIKAIESELTTIRQEMLALERRFLDGSGDLPNGRGESARNLVHYVALRRHDLRPVQARLAALGLSSLGRAEAQVLDALDAVLAILRRLDGRPDNDRQTPSGKGRGRKLLAAHADALLGPGSPDRDVRIMVTMPSEAVADYALVRDLVASGMNCMRINTAHDDRDAWERMIGHLERARQETSRDCRVLIDLAGPKLRTGPIEPGPPIVKWRPSRDAYGRVIRPARVWLTGRQQPRPAPSPAAAALQVVDEWQAGLRVGDSIKLFDARDSMRRLEVTECAAGGVWAESDQTAYVVPGTTLHLTCDASRDGPPRVCEVNVGDLPRTPQSIRLSEGDRIVLTRAPRPGRAARRGETGALLEPATLSVTLPEIFDDVRAGESIWFDDGRIGGTIRDTDGEQLVVEITHAAPGGSKLAADKGINLPDSVLRLPPLTAKDLEDLPFVVAHANLVGYSFVRTETDVRELQGRLAALGGEHLGLVLKIETRRAFEQLPALLLAAMHSPSAGVMIARGDLAIECGFERLAEIQEEILWLAEASHTPVIWATQVLEHLAQAGTPSRAEISDAAMGERAECVMLNKGPYIVHAVRTLDDILRRMQAHQQKKSAMLRHLDLADRFTSGIAV